MIVTRFAPSPTGYLHLGHAYAAIFAHDMAREVQGRFLLRLEDIDATRAKPEFANAILEDMNWLGLRWDGAVLTQSERFPAYRAALDHLEALGLLYPCFCTRSDIAAEIERAGEAPHGPEGPLYPGTCRVLAPADRRARIEAGIAYALRLNVEAAAKRVGALSFYELRAGELAEIAVDPLIFGDVVLARKETPASYHLAVVVDDAFQGVTHVTRGNDLFSATHIQRVLQALLGLPAPAYAHHALILDAAGRKFSKRDQAVNLRSLRAQGETPAAIRERLLASFAQPGVSRTLRK
jgi:glutamyl-Q tRNA(Asp) synthetase